VTQFGDLVYVLNAGLSGSTSGFKLDDENCVITPIEGSTRSLGLDNEKTPVFTTSPGQIGFTPDGKHILITNKGPDPVANMGTLIMYGVNGDGTLSEDPTITPGPGPFSFAFDDYGHVFVTEVFPGALSSYSIDESGLNQISRSVITMQDLPCWDTYFGGFVATSNNGSGTMIILRVDDSGALSLVGDGVAASATEGIVLPIDLEFSPDGKYLYIISTMFDKEDEDQSPNIVVFRNEGDSLTILTAVSEGVPAPSETKFGVAGIAIL